MTSIRGLNEVLHIDERIGLGIHSDTKPINFRRMMDRINLIEMQMRVGYYTWTNGVLGMLRWESKIERALMNNSWNGIRPNMVL